MLNAFYLDASALVKRYVAEQGSTWVESLCFDDKANAIAVASIGIVEVAAALAGKHRGGYLLVDDYQSILADLLSDARTRFRQVVISQAVIDRAIALTRRHRLRGYDAVHLASPLILNDALLAQGLTALTMVAADDNLLAAAAAEGLPTENPNQHS